MHSICACPRCFFFSANAIRLHSAVHRWQSCVNKFILRKNFCSVFIYCACNLKCFELVHSLPILLCAEHSCGSIRKPAAAAKKESKSTTILDVSNAEMAHMVSLPLPLTSVLPVDWAEYHCAPKREQQRQTSSVGSLKKKTKFNVRRNTAGPPRGICSWVGTTEFNWLHAHSTAVSEFMYRIRTLGQPASGKYAHTHSIAANKSSSIHSVFFPSYTDEMFVVVIVLRTFVSPLS